MPPQTSEVRIFDAMADHEVSNAATNSALPAHITTLDAPSAGGGRQRAPHTDWQGAAACLPACLPSGTRHAHDCVPSPQATRGAFKSTTPDDLLLAVLRATVVQSGVAPSEVQDIAVGNVQLSGAYAGPVRRSLDDGPLPTPNFAPGPKPDPDY